MAGPRRGKLPQTLVNVSLPDVLIDKIEEEIRRDGSATSVADFVRQAAVREIERRRGEDPSLDAGAEKTVRRARAD